MSTREFKVDTGPPLQYTNELARNVEASVEGFARMYNNDLHALVHTIARMDDTIQTLAAALVAAGVSQTMVQDIIDECEGRHLS